MPRSKKKDIEEDDEELKSLMRDMILTSGFTDDERYRKSIDRIYNKLKIIWVQECKDAVWLLKDEYVHEIAKVIYLDDQMGGNLDPSSLSTDLQNLLGWKQVQSVIEKYRAQDYSLVDADSIKAILSSIIKNKNARDADRLKAIEMYGAMYSSEGIEGVTFINDLTGKKFKKDKEDK